MDTGKEHSLIGCFAEWHNEEDSRSAQRQINREEKRSAYALTRNRAGEFILLAKRAWSLLTTIVLFG